MTVGSGDQQRTDLASERTVLALERTVLAWWRTGLASLAVAIAVGHLLPELSTSGATWPFVALGIAFAVYAIGLFAFGAVRSRGLPAGTARPFVVIAGFGALLAIATLVVVAVG